MRLLDPADRIARHRLREPATADQDVDRPGVAGQVDRPLTGRVAAAHDDHFDPRAQLRLHRRGPVIQAAALVYGRVGDIQPLVLRPGGDNDRSAADAAAIPEPDPVVAPMAAERDGLDRVGHASAEFHRLRHRARARSRPEIPVGNPR